MQTAYAVTKQSFGACPSTLNAAPSPLGTALCMQVDQLDLLGDFVDAGNYSRTCLYLTSTSAYLPEPDDQLVLVKAQLSRSVCRRYDGMILCWG